MDTRPNNNLYVLGYYVYLAAVVAVLYYTYRLDRLSVDFQVKTDSRRHYEHEKFVNDFKP